MKIALIGLMVILRTFLLGWLTTSNSLVVIALVFMPFLGLFAIIFGLDAKNDIKKNPRKFSGKKKVNFAIWLGTGLLLTILILLFSGIFGFEV